MGCIVYFGMLCFRYVFDGLCDPEYMCFYGTGKLKTEEEIEEIFKGRLAGIWESDLPVSLTLVVLKNEQLIGFISVGPLNSEPEIARIIDKKFSGGGLGTFCAKTVISLLQ